MVDILLLEVAKFLVSTCPVCKGTNKVFTPLAGEDAALVPCFKCRELRKAIEIS